MAGDNALMQDENLRDSIPKGGSGFRCTYPLNAIAGMSGAANFPALTNATNPAKANLGNGHLGVSFAANDDTPLYVPWVIPGEYDTDSDEFSVLLLVSSPGNDVAQTMQVTGARSKANLVANQKFVNSAAAVGVAPAALTTAPATQTLTAAITTPVLLTFTFTSPALNPYDPITIIVTPGSHATDAISLHGMFARIKRHAGLRYFPDRTR